MCKNAIVLGGSDGFGFAAADHLLLKGARTVVIADHDPEEGRIAVERLCSFHGKNRSYYAHYNIMSDCHSHSSLHDALCKLKVIHIIFNNVDKEKTSNPKIEENTIHKTIRIGLELLGKNNGGSGGIIINCASIFGFLGWPQDPFPIYCNKEPAIEVTRHFAKKYNVETTGVRLVALCPTNKHLRDIGLPIFPDPLPNKTMCELPTCIPHSKYHIGTAVSHILAWAKNGSAWLVEPAISVNQIPQLLHFPEKEGEQVDPKVYETQYCTVNIDPPCAKAKVCTPTKEEMCIKKEKKDKKKKKKKEKK
ncbi:15-hydroxyprostaglandin dehydrogenase [NAD(+)] isoform X3 [Apis mellifera]|nr:15-hydroxyprostaglandin dehydrogenase [NAD(+)] isoform X3 [Apis mellifera]XP_026299215.1 15-hydroxyprostaglandin dehydrogenase [NAD(+)] isoform X3 [Apis mellifera]|eukprot:XP_006560175.1 15-hydroxyprostaglandin dehydrogenase [NAD(+)] isoform X3 [Apis mellifera]